MPFLLLFLSKLKVMMKNWLNWEHNCVTICFHTQLLPCLTASSLLWRTALCFRTSKPPCLGRRHRFRPFHLSGALACFISGSRGGRLRGGCEGGGVVDVLLDPVPAFMCQPAITVHFAASSILRFAQPRLPAGVSLRKSSVIVQECNSVKVWQTTSLLYRKNTENQLQDFFVYNAN